MKMNKHKETIQFDSHALGLAFKDARERKGWTQDYLAERVGKTSRTIMGIENKGQHPSFDLLYQLATLLEVSIDRYFFIDVRTRANHHGGDSGRNTKGQRNGGSRLRSLCFFAILRVPLNGKQCLCGHRPQTLLVGARPKPVSFGPT